MLPVECTLPLPEVFAERMRDYLREEYNSFLICYEKQKFQALRINLLKKGMNPERTAEILGTLQIPERKPVPWAEGGYYYEETPREKDGCHPGRHPYHEMGLYYIQEPSAMSAAAFLKARPNERVLDLCAAPGGKATQIAAGMGQQGLLIANEIHPVRAKILSQNIERMGIANAVVTNEDSETLARHFPCYFHRILVDAPCSGEGMFRKKPQTMQEWSLENILTCARRQQEILDHAAAMLMPGGRIVYSTCTFAPEENEQTVTGFLKKHPEFYVVRPEDSYFDDGRPDWADGSLSLRDTRRIWPHKVCGEGHYVAVLQKEGDSVSRENFEGRKRKAAHRGRLDKEQRKSLEEFVCTSLADSSSIRRILLDQADREERLLLYGDNLYLCPQEIVSLTGVHVLRPGLHIGIFRKNRMEPAHALALFLGRDEVKGPAELSLGQAVSYHRGESLPTDTAKGWRLVCVDGFSAGWGKSAGGILKNHYPKGLRR